MSEDDQLRSMLRGYIEHVGYVVIACTDGQCVTEICSSGRDLDLLLADIQLHDDAFLFLEELAANFPKVPVLVTSEPTQATHLRQAVESRGWKLLCKPLLLPDVLRSIQDAIDPQLFDGPLRTSRKSKHHPRVYPFDAGQVGNHS
jgi:CheY-like chemotaxis protein